jgi:hypothetical protein
MGRKGPVRSEFEPRTTGTERPVRSGLGDLPRNGWSPHFSFMNVIYDPATHLRQYPLPMARFGQNPYGDNLYRIVFAPSRCNLAGGVEGQSYRWVPTYRSLGEAWVMERWLPAEEFAKCSRAKWDRDLLILGPWPERGEFAHCHTFEACGPVDANLDKLVAWIEAGRQRSFSENLTACRDEYERDTRERRSKMDAIIRNALPSFGTSAFVGSHGQRGTKTAPVVRTANELQLPTGNNKFVTLR